MILPALQIKENHDYAYQLCKVTEQKALQVLLLCFAFYFVLNMEGTVQQLQDKSYGITATR